MDQLEEFFVDYNKLERKEFKPASYPSLQWDISTEVVIIGAGISGALVAWKLCQAGPI
jgi:hypothetical protein